MRYLGPGFIMSAAIVGSGELIATTTLGAKAGFVTFWVILVSCLVKVTLQLEFGKNAIYTGTFTMHNFNRLPGWRLGRAHWSIWLWLSLQGLKLLQVGGIIGGVAIVLHMVMPGVSVNFWALAAALLTSLLVYRGYYGLVEKGSLFMIVLFSSVVLISLFLLQGTVYAISWENFKEGLSFNLPPAAVAVAFGAFGITGVGGDEIMYYNYWCIEKGYAAYTGPRDDSEAWARRAKGWIEVMYLDALLSMVVYTVVTAAFYLLGAAVLHRGGEVPEGYRMIEVLSRIFTETLGPGAKALFLVGAFTALYSTLFTATASWARVWGDAFGELGWIKFGTLEERRRAIAVFSWVFPLAWCVFFLFFQAPVMMVILGGIATSVLLLLIVWVAYMYRYHELPAALAPSRMYDVFFWISVVSILIVSGYGVWQVV
ncbi:Mn2+/Fe2+ NRAMP family transporter [Rhabdobacter roseus]|uniref:Mn2+/Fe2+ NRAMP family transporter n=1 Tax=Rhabdobacter roseus TaxID=1655419 RepID=A0A840TG84_9BACT|nr:Nramp family divalent metal transporter [Rhabdobacter roseus]MBB5282221.1 Mn2+/Fe2+ NRAMP family transporter [Rhabdobacter roseus]